MILIFLYHLLRLLRTTCYHFHDLPIDLGPHGFRIRTQVFAVSKAHITDFIVHAQLSYNTMSDLIRFFKVIRRSVSAGPKEVLLSASPTQDETNLIHQLALGIEFVLSVKVLSETQGSLGSRDDGQFKQRICAFQEPGDDCMSRLMNGYNFFLLGTNNSFFFDPTNQSLGCHLEVVGINKRLVVSSSQQSCFVAKISYFSATESGSQRSQSLSEVIFIFVGLDDDLFQVNVKYLSPALKVRKSHLDHPVKPPRTSKSSIQQAYSIGGRHYNHICISPEAIHLHQDLIQSVVPLIMRSVTSTSLATNCIYFVDENYRRRLFSSSVKKVSHSRSSYSNENFDEVRA